MAKRALSSYFDGDDRILIRQYERDLRYGRPVDDTYNLLYRTYETLKSQRADGIKDKDLDLSGRDLYYEAKDQGWSSSFARYGTRKYSTRYTALDELLDYLYDYEYGDDDDDPYSN